MSSAEFYRLVSAAIRPMLTGTCLTDEECRGARAVACELERAFAARNIKFDAVRFRRDCGIE